MPGCPSLPIPQLRQAEKPPEKPTGIKILRKFLHLQNRTRKVVIGDGNCLFRALSIQLFNHELLYTRLRAILALCHKENPQWYSAIWGGQGNFLTEHVAKMERNGTWGTQVSQLLLYLQQINFIKDTLITSYNSSNAESHQFIKDTLITSYNSSNAESHQLFRNGHVPEMSEVEGGQTSRCVGVVRRKSYTREAKMKVVQFFEANCRNLHETCKRFSLNNRTVKR